MTVLCLKMPLWDGCGMVFSRHNLLAPARAKPTQQLALALCGQANPRSSYAAQHGLAVSPRVARRSYSLGGQPSSKLECAQ